MQDLYKQDNFFPPCAYPQLSSWKSAHGYLKLPEKLKLEDSKSSEILHHADWYIYWNFEGAQCFHLQPESSSQLDSNHYLTWRRPVFDVARTMNNCIILSITGWTQTVALLQTVQVPYCHIVSSNVANFHAADKPTPWTHAQAHRGCKQRAKGVGPSSHWKQSICRNYCHYSFTLMTEEATSCKIKGTSTNHQ